MGRRADLSSLSIAEIRRLVLEGRESPSRELLSRLEADSRRGARSIYETAVRRRDRRHAERRRLGRLLRLERSLWRAGLERIAGVDEVGVGPLAGPVVAAAVVFPPGTILAGVDDSKRLDARQREALAGEIRARASGIGIGAASPREIDRWNVYRAALVAMRRAVEALPVPPEHLLLDARELADVPIPQTSVTRGDATHFSIAAASIVAKVHRDALMREIDTRYPGYGFAKHKGYGSADHQQAIRRLGPCPEHRHSFAPVGDVDPSGVPRQGSLFSH